MTTELIVEGTAEKAEQSANIASWDMSMVLQYLVERKGWTLTQCADLEREYKRYISLCLSYPDEKLTPSRDVDEVWHTHILFTKNYRRFCQAVNGAYLDHSPHLEADKKNPELKKLPQRTMELYERHFGKADSRIWPWASAELSDGGNCTDASCGDCSSSDCGPRCS
jgi:hypothetical protein